MILCKSASFRFPLKEQNRKMRLDVEEKNLPQTDRKKNTKVKDRVKGDK